LTLEINLEQPGSWDAPSFLFGDHRRQKFVSDIWRTRDKTEEALRLILDNIDDDTLDEQSTLLLNMDDGALLMGRT
jgi:hypothetical protein